MAHPQRSAATHEPVTVLRTLPSAQLIAWLPPKPFGYDPRSPAPDLQNS